MTVTYRYPELIFQYGDYKLGFTLRPLVNKININPENQTELLNCYLKYKGSEFCAALWEKIENAYYEIEKGLVKELEFIKEIDEIIDLLDLTDVLNYIKHVYKLKAPSNLLDEFTEDIKEEGRIYKDQTFIKDEYLELTALSLILKILLGPIAHFANINIILLNNGKLEYSVFRWIRRSKLYSTPPMVKTLGMINKMAERHKTTGLLIDKKIPESELGHYILSIVAIQRLATATIIDDTANNNLVNVIFKHAGSKMENRGSISSKIHNKPVPSGGEDDEGSGGYLESCKGNTDLTPGRIVTNNYIIENIDLAIDNSPDFLIENVDRAEVNKILDKIQIFNKIDIPNITIDIIMAIFKRTIPPSFRPNASLEGTLVRIAISYSFLRKIGFPRLATIITSRINNNASLGIGLQNNRSRITSEQKDKLNYWFPSKETSNGPVNLMEEQINKKANEMISYRWGSIVDKVPSDEIIPLDIKSILADFYITLEEKY